MYVNSNLERKYLHAADVKTLAEGKYYITNPVNAPNTLTSYVDVKESPFADEQRKSIEVVPVTGNTKYIARLSDNGTWSAWDSIVLKTDLENVAKTDRSNDTIWVGSVSGQMYVTLKRDTKTLEAVFENGEKITFKAV